MVQRHEAAIVIGVGGFLIPLQIQGIEMLGSLRHRMGKYLTGQMPFLFRFTRRFFDVCCGQQANPALGKRFGQFGKRGVRIRYPLIGFGIAVGGIILLSTSI